MLIKTTWSGYINKSFPKLDKDISCDVLVVGGGICGILCASFLKKKGKNVVLLEMDKIAGRKTEKTTAFITAIEDLNYSDLIETIGYKNAKLYLEANLFALGEYKKLAKELDFDFEECPSYKYSLTDSKIIEIERNAIMALGYDAELKDSIPIPLKITKALEFPNQGQMNPTKLINELIKDLNIYENTKVVNIKNGVAITTQNKVKFKDVIVATGYPFLKIRGLYFMKMHQEKSHVIDVFSKPSFKGNGVGINKNDIYFRNYKDSLILGSCDSQTGYYCDGYNPSLKLIESEYGVNKIRYKWINIDAVTLDKIPYIGRFKKADKNMYIATGFCFWGMTKAMLSAHIISDLIMGKENKFASLFSPQRPILIKPLLKNIGSAIKGLVSFKTPRCKHLGCALKFNTLDETYECPCHGSKYDSDGKLIETPAQSDLKL